MSSAAAWRRGGAWRLCATAIVAGGMALAPPPAVAQPAERQFEFHIPPQGLAGALDQYSLLTGVQLFYASNLAANQRSPGVVGRFSMQEALLILLQGTGLRPRVTAAEAVTLERISGGGEHLAAASPGWEAGGGRTVEAPLPLDALRVEAALDPLRTLGFGFYAMTVRNQVSKALREDDRLRARRYRAQFSLWLAADGHVTRSALHASSGDAATDAMLSDALQAVVVRPAPPAGMPQPVHIDIQGGGA